MYCPNTCVWEGADKAIYTLPDTFCIWWIKIVYSGISLPVFASRTNLTLHNISATLKMVKNVITNLDSSQAPDPDCISVVVVKKNESELSFMLAELFNMCLKESCFLDCWKVSLAVPVFKNIREGSTAKNYCTFSLVSVVSKVLKKNL